MTKPALTLRLANPRGFCAGVVRAIDIVEKALEKFGAPVYVRHEIVHNKFVVDSLRDKGAVFVKELDECPDDRPVVFSAHGVSCPVLNITGADNSPLTERYLGEASAALYLIRPDQHVAARLPAWDENALAAALGQARSGDNPWEYGRGASERSLSMIRATKLPTQHVISRQIDPSDTNKAL